MSREHYRHALRVQWIEKEINTGHYPNARTIAEKYEVSQKTVQRTLAYMREQLGAPLEFSHEHNGYYFTEPYCGLPMVEMTQGELLTILLTEKLARQYRGTALGDQIKRAFTKILKSATETISVDLNSLAEAYSFEAPAATEPAHEMIRTLAHATNQRLRVEIAYFTQSRGEQTARRVDPLHLRNSNGEWYLIAWDHLRKAPRVFLISRIKDLTVTYEQFTSPRGFNLDEYLNSSFGMFIGDNLHEVEIEFDERQARWVRERSKFHPSEDREDCADGRLILRMKVSALDGVKRFVMQYGAGAKVIKPEELRLAIVNEIAAMQTIYAPSN